MIRVYHHYSILEETHAEMWRTVHGKEMKELDEIAIKFMANIRKFSSAMHRVINEWRYSCEHNLTCISSNRIAWLGQAAVCIATGAPESCARVGWYFLSKEQQDKANLSASIAIKKWESKHIGEKQLELW